MFRRFLIACLFAGTLPVSQTLAQRAQPAYWVIESNIYSKDKTIIRVYNLVEQMIAEKEVPGQININRKKDRKMLDRFVKASIKDQQALLAGKGAKTATKSRRR